MSDVTLADGPADLTAEWFTAALNHVGLLDGAVVSDITTTALGTGQMSDSFRVVLDYDADTTAPRSLVAKLPSSDDSSRTTAITLRSYEKEVRFYQQVAHQLSVKLATPYFADIEPETGRFTLLLADLSPAQQGDQILGCDAATAADALTQLALLHSACWGSSALAGMDWLGGYSEAETVFLIGLLPTLWAGFQDRYAADLDGDVTRAGAALFDHLETYLTPTSTPTTLVHGDYRVDNLLFAPDGAVVGVVDWQTCSLGAALSDVSYFLGASLHPEERRKTETALLGGYVDQLVAGGVSGYGYDEAERDYRRGSYGGLLMAVGASMMVERTDRGDAMFMTMAQRHSRHALDVDAAELLT
jgi:aminoglycoside/choline kinase family phosphotransferase